jgi:hypothetical protein
MQIDIAVLGKDYRWTLDFDVRNVKSFVEGLFQKTLAEAKKIVGAK